MLEQKIEKLIEEAIQEIEEAVHRNHPHLDKRKIGSGLEANEIRRNRNKLAADIRKERSAIDQYKDSAKHKYVGLYDNTARAMSQMGTPLAVVANNPVLKTRGWKHANEITQLRKAVGDHKAQNIINRTPRIVSSAKE